MNSELLKKYQLILENDGNKVPGYFDALENPQDYNLEATTMQDYDYEGRPVDRPVFNLTHKLYHEYLETIYNPDDMEAILYAFEKYNPSGVKDI
jgi:hypothetical protein